MIIVTGASGQLGQQIVQQLLARVPAHRIGVSVRDPARASAFAEHGVRVRRGDFDDPASLAAAFEGATQVLIVSSNAAARGGDPLAQHAAAIAAARDAGALRIVYTSHMSASPTSAFAPARDHAATEAMLARSGLAWTALRNGFYAESALQLMGDGPARGMLELPQDGPVAWTTHADLAEAAAQVLAQPQPEWQVGPTPPLTAAVALDFSALAAVVADVCGRPLERRVLDDAVFEERLAARGVPASVVHIMLGLYLAARAGEFAATDPALERLLGRRPEGVRGVLAAQLAR